MDTLVMYEDTLDVAVETPLGYTSMVMAAIPDVPLNLREEIALMLFRPEVFGTAEEWNIPTRILHRLEKKGLVYCSLMLNGGVCWALTIEGTANYVRRYRHWLTSSTEDEDGDG